jgi:hypothetical protein
MMQQPVPIIFALYQGVVSKQHSRTWNLLCGFGGKVLSAQPIGIKENVEHTLNFSLHLLCLLRCWTWQ